MELDLSQMDTIQWLRYGYLGAASGVILLAALPPLRRRFLTYGPRSHKNSPEGGDMKKKDDDAPQQQSASSNPFSALLDTVASCTVPHDWFCSFYFLSLSLCAFWPGEILGLQGPLWRMFRDYTPTSSLSMTFPQLQTTWAMLFAQSARRLYECLDLPSSSESQMFVGHWVMGIAFYAATSVAVWVEGIETLRTHTPSPQDLVLRTPSFRSIVSILIFLLASGFQHDVHSYLAYLKTSPSDKPSDQTKADKAYKLPTHPAFSALLCPHYTAEILIYLAMAINAAPMGSWVNGTMASAFVFVGVNLGVTAWSTREWYVRVFGEESVKGRWRMLPFVY